MDFFDDNKNILYVIIIIIVLVVLLIVFIILKRKKYESFISNQSWGYDGNLQAPYNHPNIINGPNSRLSGWQYNPQNTLVDYDYYRDNDDLKGQGIIEKEKIAPLTTGDIGILTNPTYQVTPAVPSTRVPSDFSSIDNYVLPNPSTQPELNGPSVNYEWH